ncbi:MAG: PEP-CTERM sorting domain-containing protein [Pseudomonadota bacterium]
MKHSIAAVLALLLPGMATATVIVDQQSLPGGHQVGLNGHYIKVWQQEVTAGVTGQLVGIDLWMYPGEGRFFVNPGEAYQPRTQVNNFAFSEELHFLGTPGQAEWFYLDLTDANIFLSAGDAFIFGMQGTLGGGGSLYPFGFLGDPYAGGTLYSQTGAVFQGDMDFAFRSYVMTTTQVPEPSSLLLLVVGMLAMGRLASLRGPGLLARPAPTRSSRRGCLPG